MIRRNDGNDWLLISQVEHARLAVEIANAWQVEEPALSVPRDLLLSAIRHHDDGWEEWAHSPTIDTTTGRPRDFTEMEMRVASRLWRASIEKCADLHPLAGLWVSQHFCYLAAKAKESRLNEPDEMQPLENFLAEQRTQQGKWRKAFSGEFSDHIHEELIETGYRSVQFFDKVSLWLCCTPKAVPFDVLTPSGNQIVFDRVGPGAVCIEPFALSVARLELSAPAKRIPAIGYQDDMALHEAIAMAEEQQLHWTIQAE